MTHSNFPPDNRKVWPAIWFGAKNRCPQCGSNPLFRVYLKPLDNCQSCGLDFSGHRADDLPPYITITIVGHIVVTGVLLLERQLAPETWVHMALWLPLTLILSLLLMQPVKGAVIGLQWALRMHGFEHQPELSETKASDTA